VWWDFSDGFITNLLSNHKLKKLKMGQHVKKREKVGFLYSATYAAIAVTSHALQLQEVAVA